MNATQLGSMFSPGTRADKNVNARFFEIEKNTPKRAFFSGLGVFFKYIYSVEKLSRKFNISRVRVSLNHGGWETKYFGTPQGELFHRQTKRAKKRSRIRSLLRPEGGSKKLGQTLAGRRNGRSLDLTKPT